MESETFFRYNQIVRQVKLTDFLKKGAVYRYYSLIAVYTTLTRPLVFAIGIKDEGVVLNL